MYLIVYCAGVAYSSTLCCDFRGGIFFSVYLPGILMEFKNEALVEREIEIAGYLLQGFSVKMIAEITGLSKKILVAHIRNMMTKLKAVNIAGLIKMLNSKNV